VLASVIMRFEAQVEGDRVMCGLMERNVLPNSQEAKDGELEWVDHIDTCLFPLCLFERV